MYEVEVASLFETEIIEASELEITFNWIFRKIYDWQLHAVNMPALFE